MKLVSSLALATVLLTGVPAFAKEKKVAASAAYQPVLSKAFRAAIGPVQAAAKAQDAAGLTTTLATLAPLAQSPDEKFYLGQFQLNLASIKNDAAGQGKALDDMLASGSGLVTADIGKWNYYSGKFAYQANDFPKAGRLLSAAGAANYSAPDLYIMLTDASFRTGQTPAALAAADKAFAAQKALGQPVPEAWYRVVVSGAYKGKDYANTNRFMRELVAAYPSPTNWRDALVLYRDSAKLDAQNAVDVFRLMRAAKALDGERDYYEYAEFSDSHGLPGEAKAVIDEGYASGKAPRTSKAVADVYSTASTKIAADRASLAKSEAAANGAANGRTAAATGDAYLGYGDNAKAATLYRVALQKGGVDADAVNTRLGIALARSGQKDAAKAAFTAVNGPRKEIAAYWMLWLDQRPVGTPAA